MLQFTFACETDWDGMFVAGFLFFVDVAEESATQAIIAIDWADAMNDINFISKREKVAIHELKQCGKKNTNGK